MIVNEEFMGIIKYKRYSSKQAKFERGTVIIGDRIIPGYPHIPRVWHLKKGIDNYFKNDPFYIEEKIDGYNVRFFYYKGSVFGATRSGRIDPFTTEKAYELRLNEFFEKYPDYILCGEMIGNTPFTEPTKDYDVKLFIFDIINERNAFIMPEERYSMLKEFNLTPPNVFGLFSREKYDEISEILIELNKEGKEGIVLKAKDKRKQFKYVTASSDADDMEMLFALFNMPTGFFNERLLRISFFYNEFGKLPDLKSVIKKASEKWNEFEKTGKIYKTFRIFVRQLETWKWLKENVLKSKDIKIEEEIFEREEFYEVVFKKRYLKTEKRLRFWLTGTPFTD